MQSVSQITIDNFAQLSPDDHSVAIFNHYQSIQHLQRKLQDPVNEPARELLSDELRRCQQLRKLHAQALSELLEVVPTAAAA